MGWGSGSSLGENIVKRVDNRKDFTSEQKEEIYKILIDEFENFDCDTLNEVSIKRFQKVLQQVNGSDNDI